MPHLTIEFSENLRNFGQLSRLCRKLAQVLIEQQVDGEPVFPIGGIRVRALAAEAWCIGDGRFNDATFVHARFMVGAGRSGAVMRQTGDALFEAMKLHFARDLASHSLALSLEIGEFSEAGTWKHNNLHARFAGENPGDSPR